LLGISLNAQVEPANPNADWRALQPKGIRLLLYQV
jgi:hypothetical protein